MTDGAAVERRVRTGGRIAVGVVALGALVLVGAATSVPAAFAAVAGGGLIAGAIRKLTSEENADRARGSVGLAVGSVVVVAAVGAAGDTLGSLVVVLGSALAVAAVGLDALVEEPEAASDTVGAAVKGSGTVLAVAAVLAMSIHTGLLVATGVAAVTGSIGLVGTSSFVALVSLEVLAVSSAVLVGTALTFLDRWLPDRGGDEDSVGALEQVGVAPGEVPRLVWGALGLQVLIALIDPAAGWFEGLLGLFAVLGDLVATVLQVGVLHLPLALVSLVAGVVVLAGLVQRLFLWWAGRNPPETLAYSAGGVVVGLLAVAASAVPPVTAAATDPLVPPLSVALLQGYGAPAVVAVLVALALVAVRLLLLVIPVLYGAGVVPSPTGYATGAGALFLAALVGATSEATPVAVFVAVAAALLAWDLGRNATELRRQLGRTVHTRDVETTHATASVLVGAVAVALAAAVAHLLAPALTFPTREEALLAAVLSVVALLAFTLVAERRTAS